jgi:hypothetical protein
MNLLSIKPVLTVKHLQYIWYLFLVERAMQLTLLIYALTQNNGTFTQNISTVYFYLSPILFLIVFVLLVRLALEIGVHLLQREGPTINSTEV